MITSETLSALDRWDTLASFRDEFDLPEGTIYLDGNSLGPLPPRTLARLIDDGSFLARERHARGLDLQEILADFGADFFQQEPNMRGDRIIAQDRMAFLSDIAQAQQGERAEGGGGRGKADPEGNKRRTGGGAAGGEREQYIAQLEG